MTLDELNSIDINNPDQVKRVQEFLKKQGYYGKKIDGVWGEGMVKARKDFSATQAEKEARDAKEAGAKALRDEVAADAAAVRAEKAAEAKAIRDAKKTADDAALASKAAEEKQIRDTQTGAVTAVSAGGGLGIGLLGGKLADTMANSKIKEEMSARAGQLSNLAETSRAIDPTSPVARALHTDAAAAADAGRLTKTPVPWGTGALGTALLGMGLYSTLHRAPEAKSDIEGAIWNGTGYGEGAAGVKILGDSLRRYKNPGMSYPADDVAAIEGSRRIAKGGELTPVAPPRGTPPYTPPAAPPPTQASPPVANTPAPPAPPQGPPPAAPTGTKIPHSDRLINAAREAGATGPLNKATASEYLAANVTDANRGSVARALGVKNGPNLASRLSTAIGGMASKRGVSSIALPLMAGGLAFEATRNQANAADGGPGSLAAPAAAGATAAGTAYGGSKLAQALGPMAGKALSAGGSMMGPMSAGDMTDMSQDEVNQGRNWMARNIPAISEALGGYPKQALDMSQVPEPSPMRSVTTGQNSGPMMQAAALEIPEVPENAAMNAEMEARFPTGIQQRLDRMVKLGANPQQIAGWLNQAVR